MLTAAENVGWLQVAMDNISPVHERQPASQLTASFVNYISIQGCLHQNAEALAPVLQYDTDTLLVRHHIHHLCYIWMAS